MIKNLVKTVINPSILKWYRGQLSMDTSLTAEKIGVSESRLTLWENGEEAPTMKQLQKIANVFKVNISVFYLPNHPTKLKPIVDYRSISLFLDKETLYRLEMNILEASRRRDMAAEIYTLLDKPPLEFNFRISRRNTVMYAAASIRNFLEVDYTKIQSFRDEYKALSYWKFLIEKKNILVSQTSLNSHLSLPVKVTRGFCIADTSLPAIVINSKDSVAGRIFTLLHEISHLALGWSSEVQSDTVTDGDEEVFCNAIAGEVLVPESLLRLLIITVLPHNNVALDLTSIKTICETGARRFWVSEEVIMRRLLHIGKISKQIYESFRAQLQAQITDLDVIESTGAPPYHRRVLNNHGLLYTRMVIEAFHREKISLGNAGKLLNTNLNHFSKIEDACLNHV